MFNYKLNGNGTKVPHFYSGPLVDFFEPELEGAEWAKDVLRRFSPQSACILGVGGGYHIEALVKAGWSKPLRVFETSQALVHECAERCNYENLEIVLLDAGTTEDLFRIPKFVEMLQSLRLCLPFRRAWTHQLAFFSELFLHLTLRSEESLKVHILHEGHSLSDSQILNPERLARATIHDVDGAIEFNSTSSNLVHRCIMEMIK